MQMTFKFASNFPTKKLHFILNKRMHICIRKNNLYLCNIKEEERILLELINEVLFKI